MIEKDCL